MMVSDGGDEIVSGVGLSHEVETIVTPHQLGLGELLKILQMHRNQIILLLTS